MLLLAARWLLAGWRFWYGISTGPGAFLVTGDVAGAVNSWAGGQCEGEAPSQRTPLYLGKPPTVVKIVHMKRNHSIYSASYRRDLTGPY